MPQFLVDLPADTESRVNALYAEAQRSVDNKDLRAAFKSFSEAYSVLVRAQPPGKRFHKGMPLHNMGLVRLLVNERRDAIRFTLWAFLEDALSKADEEAQGFPELDMPASHNLVFVLGLNPAALSAVALRVRDLVAAGRSFPNPRRLAKYLGLEPWYSLEPPRRSRASVTKPIEDRVEDVLREAGIPFARDAPINGLQVDFAIGTDSGLVVLETKPSHAGQLSPRQVEDLRSQLQRVRESAHATRALLVVDKRLKQTLPQWSDVATVDQIVGLIRAEPDGKRPKLRAIHVEEGPPRVFVAMPLSRRYYDTFFNGIRRAAGQIGVVAIQMKHEPEAGDAVNRIKLEIERASVVVADVSEARPSVLREYGYAEARDRPVIVITSTPLAELPFNVRNNTTIEYAIGATELLRRKLIPLLRTEFRKLGLIPPGALRVPRRARP